MNFLKSLANFNCKNERDVKNKELSISHFKKYGLQSLDRKFYNGHFTASGFVFNKNKTHILLTHHKFLNLWIQLGGHIDNNEKSFLDAAIRECKEESGIENIELLEDKIFDIDIHSVPINNKKNELAHLHYDIRYLLFSQTDEFIINEESFELKWIKVEKIGEIPELQNITQKITNIF